LPPEAVYIAALVVLVLFPFGVAAGINHSVVALFDRGDMDLLASSPIGSRTVFASRVLAVALGVFVGLGLFMLPIASLGVLMGLPQLLGAVPTLAVLAVVCACAGMLITLLLVRLLGPRRARTAAQLLAAFAGVLLFLVSQVPALLAGRWDVGDLVTNAARHFQPGGLFAADSLVWLPFRSLLLDPLGTLTALAGAGVVFWATVGLLHRAFAHGIALGEGRPVRRRVGERPVQFASRAPLGTLLAKEWKLILRDPFLISQVLLQVIYFLPAIYILFFTDTSVFAGLDLGPILAVVIVALSGVLTASIARITVVGEEAHDLLVSSPVGGRTVRRGKLLAAVVPVLLLAVPTSVGIFVLSPQAGVVAALLSVTGSLAVGALRSWNPVTAGRRDLFKNRSMGDPVMAVLEV